jgi:hypothetical protein
MTVLRRILGRLRRKPRLDRDADPLDQGGGW